MTMAVQQQLNPQAIAMLNALAGMTTKDAGTTPGAQLHGPGGLLATPGLNRQLMNAMIAPRGLAGRLQVRPSIDTNEIFGIMTGQLASTGAEPDADCHDWPIVGQFKLCRQQHPFGQQGRMSQVLNVKHAGEIINRGEFTDNVLFGAPATDNGTLPGPIDWARAMQVESEKKIAELYMGYFRDFSRFLYTGNPANTGTAGFVQYRGLDLLINTNKRDAITGVACPAADSQVVDLGGMNVNTQGAAVYGVIANSVLVLTRLAEQLSLDVTWAIAMRWGAFMAITNVWPCVYATSGCAVNTIIHTQGMSDAIDLRDDMRRNKYLLIEGNRYEVIIDDSIAETVPGAPGTYQSDLYFVPMTANGQPMTFLEYFPMNQQAIQAANRLAPGGFFDVLQNGRFLFVKLAPTHTCVQVEIIERPRVVLLAPFLAARWLHLQYTLAIHEREPFPGDAYFQDGGLPTTPAPYFYPNG